MKRWILAAALAACTALSAAQAAGATIDTFAARAHYYTGYLTVDGYYQLADPLGGACDTFDPDQGYNAETCDPYSGQTADYTVQIYRVRANGRRTLLMSERDQGFGGEVSALVDYTRLTGFYCRFTGKRFYVWKLTVVDPWGGADATRAAAFWLRCR